MKKQKAEKANYKVPKGWALVLRTSDKNRCSYNGFQYPEFGNVSAPDWKPIKECGNGLHGALYGEGDGSLFNWENDAVWQVLEVKLNTIINLDGKIKFPCANVVYSGDRLTATNIIKQHYPGICIIGGTATAGDRGTATAGYGGTATAGYGGTATAGDGGTATAGDGGTATAGDEGTATAGDEGTATAGYGGTIIVKYWNDKRYKFQVGYIGENGIEANTAYCLNDKFEFVKK